MEHAVPVASGAAGPSRSSPEPCRNLLLIQPASFAGGPRGAGRALPLPPPPSSPPIPSTRAVLAESWPAPLSVTRDTSRKGSRDARAAPQRPKGVGPGFRVFSTNKLACFCRADESNVFAAICIGIVRLIVRYRYIPWPFLRFIPVPVERTISLPTEPREDGFPIVLRVSAALVNPSAKCRRATCRAGDSNPPARHTSSGRPSCLPKRTRRRNWWRCH